MNLGEMRTFIKDYIGETITGFRTETQLSRWCNTAYRKIIRNRNDWNFLLTTKTTSTEDGEASYTLPTDCVQVKEVRLAGDVLPFVQYYRKHLVNVASYFTVVADGVGGHCITLYPTPEVDGSDDLRIVYQFEPDTLSDDTDEPVFHNLFHDIIPTFVCYVALRKEDDSLRDDFLKEYADGFKRLLAWDRNEGYTGYKELNKLDSLSHGPEAIDYRNNY